MTVTAENPRFTHNEPPAREATDPHRYNYDEAVSRNLGWVTEGEQQTLRRKRIAIAGMGGVGGAHLLTLSRLGIGGFHIADFDAFELANFNRQAGACLSHLDQPKVEVMSRMAKDINPTAEIESFGEVTVSNLDAFLKGVDLFIDGIDFFAIRARRMVFQRCHELGIPAITAAPLGMGAALLVFLPGRTTFEQYFRLEGHDEPEQLLRFLVGLAPAALHRGYLVDPARVNLAERRGPSTPIAIELCASLASSSALKVLLDRGKVYAAPWSLQIDAYRNKLAKTRRRGGNRHPMQRLALKIGRRQFLKHQP